MPEKSDVIIGLGSHDLGVARHVVLLYTQGYAPLIVFSGNVGRLTHGVFTEPEADAYRREAVRLGVPAEAILTEVASTNTGQNIVMSQQVLADYDIRPKRVLLVHKPYMLRRDYATFMKQWEGAEMVQVRCLAEDAAMETYLNQTARPDETIAVIVGDVQRIIEYPKYGFQIEQDIPDNVMQAYNRLVKRGYDTHLI
ncbi:MAG: YdcF family protein [Patescibacteria group bacterium]